MVKGVAKFRQRFARIPEVLEKALKADLEIIAGQIVRDMNNLKPIPEISIRWTFGRAPEGALALGTVKNSDKGDLFVTIYATAIPEGYPGGFGAIARWFEFGTSDRFTKDGGYRGRITASPYFYPAYRANRRRVKARLSRKVRKVMKGL